jgi:outer membrane protein assembly factor BamB
MIGRMDSSRRRGALLLAALAVPVAGLAGTSGDRARRVAQALRESILHLAPAANGAPQSEPAGDVAIDYAPRSKPLEALAEGVRLEQEGQWAQAAQLYQQLIDEAPATLSRRGPRLYLPLRRYVTERLSHFPPEGLKEYRQQVDRHAEALYQAALDSRSASHAELEALTSRYLLSSWGDDALARLASAWLDRAQFGRALRAWQRLLRLYPDPDVDLSALAVKAAVCLARLGKEEAARSLAEELAAVLGAEHPLILGGEAVAAARLPDLLSRLRPTAHGEPRSPARPGRLAWSDTLPSPETAEREFPPRRRRFWPEDRPPRPTVPVRPALTDAAAIYPSRGGILARDLSTGKLRWEWRWPTELAEDAPAPYAEAHRAVGAWACSLDQGLALCPVPLRRVTGRRTARFTGQLVAVGLKDGRTAWIRQAADGLSAPLNDGYYVCPPLSCDGRLVVAFRAGQSGQEYYLASLSPEDGQLLWRTYICGRTPDPVDRMGRHRPAFESMPAAADGLVATCAGDGVIAAVSSATGELRWVARYDQIARRRSTWSHRETDAWQDATPRIAAGRVYVTPRDSDFLYALDLDSGELLWRREREDYRYLVAARDKCVFLAGARVACLDAKGELEWERELPNAVVGRPALAGHVLHLPIRGGLYFLDTEAGGPLDYVGWNAWQDGQPRSFSADIRSGDVALAPDRLLVTTPHTLNAFEPLRPTGMVEQLVAEKPQDPMSHYALAREHQWQGRLAEAAEAFERSLELLDQSPAALPEDAATDIRRRLAASYEALARRQEEERRIDLALSSARAALHHAPAPTARCRLSLRIARYHRRLHHWGAAASVYQDVLAEAAPQEDSWQQARRALEDLLEFVGREPYAEFERRAKELLTDPTPDALRAVVERYPNSRSAPQALLRLASLQAQGGDAAQARLFLHRLDHEYPDAPAAPEGLHRLAVGYAQMGARAMARGALRALRSRYPKWQEAEPNAEDVLARHTPEERDEKAAPIHPPLDVTWAARPDYGAAEFHVAGPSRGDAERFYTLAGSALACRRVEDGSLVWADRPGWIGISIDDADRLEGGVHVVTVYGGTPAAAAGLQRGDVLVRFDGRPVRNCARLIDICSGRPAGSEAQVHVLRDGREQTLELTLGERPTQSRDLHLRQEAWLGVQGGLVLLRHPARTTAFDRHTGQRAWSFPLHEPDASDDEYPNRDTAALAPGVLILADDRGRLVALAPSTGQQLWTAHLLQPQLHRIRLTEYGLVAASSRPPTLEVINPYDGRTRHRVIERRSLAPPVFEVHDERVLCYAIGGTLGCYELAEEATRWTTRLANFSGRQLWIADGCVVVHGVDRRDIEVLECRDLASGKPRWAVSLARGEHVRQARLDRHGLTAVFQRAAGTVVRRLSAATGDVDWTHELTRGNSVAGWLPGKAALAIGLNVTRDTGQYGCALRVLDAGTGDVAQDLSLSAGKLTGLRRIGGALYAVIEQTAGEDDLRRRVTRPTGIEPHFRILRIDGQP